MPSFCASFWKRRDAVNPPTRYIFVFVLADKSTKWFSVIERFGAKFIDTAAVGVGRGGISNFII
jgi:hypothetical protein